MPDKKNDINLNRYETDVAGVSMKTLEAGLWWTKNRAALKIALIVFLLLVSIASWSYTIYGFGYYLFVGMNADEQMARAMAEMTTVNHSYLVQIAPKNLILSPAGFLPNGNNYDLYLQITNPNSRWWATFDYCFALPDGEKSCGNDFMLPDNNKYLLSLNDPFKANPNNLNFSLTNLVWNKIDNHQISDWSSYLANRLNIAIANQLFTPAENNTVSEKVPLNSLTFTITDNSAYSYFSVPLTIILTNGNRLVYIDRYTLDSLTSHQSRPVEITWPGTMGGVTGIDITPDLNILDQSIYQQPK